LLLSAGPGAGKTALLRRWQAEWGAAARYFKVTPATGLGLPLREGLLGLYPEARAAFEALSERFPRLSWGAVLGFALEEALPDAILLLDDLHLAEDSADWEGLMALCRHFPARGRLALASRHRIPFLGREGTRCWDTDHADWSERPALQDLRRLPDPLVAKILALHLLDALPVSPESFELLRRNMAQPAHEGAHALRAAWRPIAEEALSSSERSEVWRLLAEELCGHYRHHVRTPNEERILAACQRLPAEVGASHEACWKTEPLPEDPAALRALLEQPALVDRVARHRHFRALSTLHALACAEGDAPSAAAHANRMVALASRFGFARDLLSAHVARLDASMLAAAPGGIAPFLAIPPEAFAQADGLADYLRCLRDRAHLLGELGLAGRLEAIAQQSLGQSLPPPSQAPVSPALRIHVFGTFSLLTADGSELRFSRRKAQSLLALLTLQARGMFAEELAEVLFEPGEVANPQESLNSVTYAVRRSLKAVGFEHLLENEGGCYRVRWQEVAFCDLHEFDAFRELALVLEARGLAGPAAIMHAIAQAYVSGQPLGGKPAELGALYHSLMTRMQLGSVSVRGHDD